MPRAPTCRILVDSCADTQDGQRTNSKGWWPGAVPVKESLWTEDHDRSKTSRTGANNSLVRKHSPVQRPTIAASASNSETDPHVARSLNLGPVICQDWMFLGRPNRHRKFADTPLNLDRTVEHRLIPVAVVQSRIRPGNNGTIRRRAGQALPPFCEADGSAACSCCRGDREGAEVHPSEAAVGVNAQISTAESGECRRHTAAESAVERSTVLDPRTRMDALRGKRAAGMINTAVRGDDTQVRERTEAPTAWTGMHRACAAVAGHAPACGRVP
ncbi:hypothetical protein LXA43DRAFT_1061251 [Ganoderma leucocontextum]|nr:hypothetical protein LXA43DRAFT_1061251 [Ganoderma leucocontextum]